MKPSLFCHERTPGKWLIGMKRRKVRCSGTHPCEYCLKEEVSCVYDDTSRASRLPQARQKSAETGSANGYALFPVFGLFLCGVIGLTHSYSNPRQQTNQIVFSGDAIIDYVSSAKTRPQVMMQGISTATTPRASQRNSLEPPQTFVEGQHIGPISGVSFLYHAWNRVPV